MLIADDHDVVRRGLRTLIETRPNLQVVAEASEGRAVLEDARATRPDIAVIDYSLPELNCLDLTMALKREFPRMEVLLYTMHDREELILDVLRAGAPGPRRSAMSGFLPRTAPGMPDYPVGSVL